MLCLCSDKQNKLRKKLLFIFQYCKLTELVDRLAVPMVELLSAAGRVLGFECEGDVVFLVRLQFVSRQLQSLDVGSLLQLEGDRLVLAPACRHHGALHTAGAPADLGQHRLAGQPPAPQSAPSGLAGAAGNPRVGVGSVVAPVAGVGAVAGVSGSSAGHSPASTTACTENNRVRPRFSCSFLMP